VRYDFYWMAFIAISGEPGCRHAELARLVSQRMECELITEPDLEKMMAGQFGQTCKIPDRVWGEAATSVIVTLAGSLGSDRRHLVICYSGAGMLGRELPGVFRLHVVAPERVRLANLAAERQFTRAAAKQFLRKMIAAQSEADKGRFGQRSAPATSFDLLINEQGMGLAQMWQVLVSALQARGLLDAEPLPAAALAKVQFQLRLRLARYDLAPPDRKHPERRAFGHPSEEVFANLLDFYRIAWDYEPRSFPLQWDKDGKVSEAFTPDFYLPEFDLYVELTTMKQAHVTRKNRKVRLLRAIYPHVNIQVFYQKDVQDLVMNYRLPEQLAR